MATINKIDHSHLDSLLVRAQVQLVDRHLDNFIFRIAWALLASVVILFGGQALPESYQVYAFVGELYRSFFKLNFAQIARRLSEIYSSVERVFERELLLQINDPLQI